MTSKKTLTLGEIISTLEKLDPSLWISFDFCGLVPCEFMSWRYFNSQLALSYAEGEMRLYDFLELARSVEGKELRGYKGGMYLMTLDTPVWVSKYSRGDRTAITGIKVIENEWHVKLITEWIDL